jgi:hypothetical protein
MLCICEWNQKRCYILDWIQGAFYGEIITEKDSIDTLRRDKYDYRQSGK